ncbi:MAG: hypothetical protein V7L11_07140 [Nostoc sp.]|uniref:hypothetical protein n=1 Tax=Nostoc sp. TaxID=1180 RepID=UPI002FF8BA71
MNLYSPSDWALVYEENLTPQPGLFTMPILLNSNIVAIYITTPTPKPTWFTGAWVNQLIATGLIDSSTTWNINSNRILLGKNVIVFPQSLSSYSLQFSFPAYFPTVFLSVWEYTGTDSQSSTGELATVVSEVATIVNNVATIAEQVGNLITIVDSIRTLVGG